MIGRTNPTHSGHVQFVLSKKEKKNGSKKGERNLHFAPYIFKIISKKTEFENHFL